MDKVINYFQNVYNELANKTSWPSMSELISSAKIVMIASVIIAIVVFFMDYVFENVLKFTYNLF